MLELPPDNPNKTFDPFCPIIYKVGSIRLRANMQGQRCGEGDQSVDGGYFSIAIWGLRINNTQE